MTNTFQISGGQCQTPYKTLTHKLTKDDLLNKPEWFLLSCLYVHYQIVSEKGPAALVEADNISFKTVGLPILTALETIMEMNCRDDLVEQGDLDSPLAQLSGICDHSGRLVPYNEVEHQQYLRNWSAFNVEGLPDLAYGLRDLAN